MTAAAQGHDPARAPSRPPAVGAVLDSPRLKPLIRELGHRLVAGAVRQEIERGRLEPIAPGREEVAVRVSQRLSSSPARLRRVINATGVILHTNLGRAPIGAAVAARAMELATHYSSVELDLSSGRRADRQDLLQSLLCQLSGAEAAMVVNNGAAAVLLALSVLCRGRDVLVSRGEAVEIGGGFRIPEILRLSGARLVDVGTTNRTRVGDYTSAFGPKTAAVLRVHQSNFAVSGFVERPSLRAVAAEAHERGVLVLDDAGSGLLVAGESALGLEDVVRDSVAQGADLVFSSGDKLVGASQAGIVVGRDALVKRLRRSPMTRALRPDKLQLAVLEQTLLCYVTPGRLDEIPTWRMLRTDRESLRARASEWAGWLGDRAISAEVVPLEGAVGGGTTPGPPLDSFGVLVPHPRTAALRRRLLGAEPAVLALERDRGIVLDARTVLPGEDQELLTAVVGALAEVTPLG